MKLTPDYCRIHAVFDSPVETTGERGKIISGEEYLFQTFLIPPFEYEVSFKKSRYLGKPSYTVSFKLLDIYAEGEELAKIVSRALKRPVSIHNAPLMKRMVNPVGVLGTGSSSKVLGKVAQLIRDFVYEKRPCQLIFAAVEESRISLYRKMISYLAPSSRLQEPRPGVFMVSFK